MAERRQLIAETAIEVIDAHGSRGLTHRRVDAVAGLPPGTTSYYAPTRKDLLALAVERIASDPALLPPERSDAPRPSTVGEAVQTMVAMIERTAEAGAALRARTSILPEVRQWPDIAEQLYEAEPVTIATRHRNTALLEAIGVADADEHVDEFMALCDALLVHYVTRRGALNPGRVLERYLIGLGARV